MKILQTTGEYSLRLIRLWLYWIWVPALELLGVAVETFVPTFSPPRWLYLFIPALGFVVANVKLFSECQSEKHLLEYRVAQLEATITDPMIQARAQFQKIAVVMRDLLAEMKQDLISDETQLTREFYIIRSKGFPYLSPKLSFVYYEDEYDHLQSKMDRLEGCGFVERVDFSSIHFRMTDVFVELLTEADLTT